MRGRDGGVREVVEAGIGMIARVRITDAGQQYDAGTTFREELNCTKNSGPVSC